MNTDSDDCVLIDLVKLYEIRRLKLKYIILLGYWMKKSQYAACTTWW